MATEGTSDRSSGDPVLDQAFSEMSAEGNFDATAPIDDLGSAEVTQADGSASAAPAAAPAPATGDDGSGKTGTTAPPTTPPVVGAPGAASAATDPLAGTEPFKYSVNGQAQSLAWAHRVPGEGVLLTEAEVPHLEQLAERAETLDRATRELTAQNSTYERLSTWTVTDADGKPQTLSGQQGLEAMRVKSARGDAAITLVDELLSDPAKLLSFLAPDPKDPQKVVINPGVAETFLLRLHVASEDAEKRERQHIATLGKPAPSTTGATAPPSYTAEAPRIIQAAAGPAFDALTPDDKTLLAMQLDRYVRPVTEADRQHDPLKKLGEPIVDAAFAKVVLHLASQRQVAKQTAVVAEKAGKHNGGMDKGRQPAKQQPKSSTPAAPPKAGERKKPDWDSPFSEAMQEMGIPTR